MDTIFQLPLFFICLLQILLALLLLAPRAIALPVSQLYKSFCISGAANSVTLTVAIGLSAILVSCIMELMRGYKVASHATLRDIAAIDYLRAQVSCVLCILNLMLLFLVRALSVAICGVDHGAKNLDAMKRQVKGLQTEYERVTKASSTTAGAAEAAGSAEVDGLKRQVDRLISDKAMLQNTLEAAEKARNGAEAGVSAMKSQMKGFDTEFDRLLEENKMFKWKLAQAGDPKYAAEVGLGPKVGKKDS
eukprot:CAMPEP_0119101428 /NCGR_PEP_ID=MMETSP1180-20130426/477_1 /TAXON_ID=3052 ORGANISM="Chlamydomonas cf sp, Strain CCMP681" /NCGR_SAMPLE_ID=MMETSP1180 /ASSEMBLY_ACC=CAM_ASM_000741 /LENGTH=247 /DNA_ID=CAMNT_0007085547 /DNA_START=83 /DNA_END=826 /DNA_ORIENTATION=+